MPQEPHFHIGSGMPQYLWREMHQSGAPCHELLEACLGEGGVPFGQFSISASICSLSLEMVMNHWSVVMNMSGVLQRQQCG